MEQNSKINFTKVLDQLMKTLNEREQEVITRRYHLNKDMAKYHTLQDIGNTYSITRERVRQIENESLRKLREASKNLEFANDLKKLEQALHVFLEKHGGFAVEAHLLDNFVSTEHDLGNYHAQAYLFLLNNFVNSVEKITDSKHFETFWKLADFKYQMVENIFNAVSEELEANAKPVSKAGLLKLVASKVEDAHKAHFAPFLEKHELSEQELYNLYLDFSTSIAENILGEFGLSHWDNICPNKLSDKINLILHQAGEPLHFKELADRVNNASFPGRKVCAATIHNELISNENYALANRGYYGKKDWDFVGGTIADLVVKVLKDSGKPMSTKEVYESVAAIRPVNQTTVYLTLLNNKRGLFDRVDKGIFKLK